MWRQIAVLAVNGPDDEAALQLAPDFRLHLDRLTNCRLGYFALIEAERATAFWTRSIVFSPADERSIDSSSR